MVNDNKKTIIYYPITRLTLSGANMWDIWTRLTWLKNIYATDLELLNTDPELKMKYGICRIMRKRSTDAKSANLYAKFLLEKMAYHMNLTQTDMYFQLVIKYLQLKLNSAFLSRLEIVCLTCLLGVADPRFWLETITLRQTPCFK